jgi:hypothetical protein
MLIACKHQDRPAREQPIRTIYIDGNGSSHLTCAGFHADLFCLAPVQSGFPDDRRDGQI